jgi:ABC-2 type transport system permease protein
MRKIAVIAKREYNAAVRTKAFIVTLVLMPVLMSGGGVFAYISKRFDDATAKKYAVIDRTPGQKLARHLEEAAEEQNRIIDVNPDKAKALGPRMQIEVVGPSAPTAEATGQQRFELCRRIEKGDLTALVEIGPEVFTIGERYALPSRVEDQFAVRFQAKGPLARTFREWARRQINEAVQRQRFESRDIKVADVLAVQTPVTFKDKALTKLDPATGAYLDAADETQIINFVLPVALIMLMFVVIMVGATPAMQGVVEEKSLRIAEVLLGSVTPFQLMAGKLLGVIGVSLTMAFVYLAGGLGLAWYFGFGDLLAPGLLAWFVVMLVLALMIFGSVFIAIGAAATDIKDTQTLLMPVMLVATLPFFALAPIMQDPSGTVARALSFFPTATPMLLVARQSVPPGVPVWEMVAGIVLVLVTTLACVWIAGRIFRIGILLHGKSPRFGDLVRSPLRSYNTRRNTSASTLPPDRTTATRRPRAPSRKSAASGAAPAPSTTWCVAVKYTRMAAAISSSDSVTTRSAQRLMRSTASLSGTRQAMPSAIVSQVGVVTGRVCANDSA